LPTGEEEDEGEQDELNSCVDNRRMPVVDANSNFCSVSSSCDNVKTTTESVEDTNNGLERIKSPTAQSDLDLNVESQQITECLPLTELCSFAQPVIPSVALNNNKTTRNSHRNGFIDSEVELRGAMERQGANFRLGAYEPRRVGPPPRSPAVDEGRGEGGRGSPRGALRRQHGKRYEKVR
jgi:hypothetical protein